MRKILGTMVLIITGFDTTAQSNQQLWIEYMMTHPFSNSWELEHDVRYSTTLSSDPFRSVRYYPSLSYSLTQHIDFLGGLSFVGNFQSNSDNTFELREMLGVRIHITPNKRILTRLLLRGENRNLLDTETKDWSSSNRLRIRGEGIFPFNNPTMYNKDKLIYGILDMEWFIQFDEELNERFANRFRIRSGVGYRFNYNFRFEFIYSFQESRDHVDDSSLTQDNIYRFRFRHFINKSKPSRTLGVGN